MQVTALFSQQIHLVRNASLENTLNTETTPVKHVHQESTLLLGLFHVQPVLLVLSRCRQVRHLVTVVQLDIHLQRGRNLAINVWQELIPPLHYHLFLHTYLKLRRRDFNCTIASTTY